MLMQHPGLDSCIVTEKIVKLSCTVKSLYFTMAETKRRYLVPGYTTRNVKKLFNIDTQASINYLTVLSQFCANYYVSTKNDIMNKTHNVNGFYNNIYYCCNAYALHL